MDNNDKVIERAVGGDEQAFRSLVVEYGPYVYRLAHRLTGSKRSAEDIAQECFLKVFRKLAQYDRRSGFETWLYRIVVNTGIDYMRKDRDRQRMISGVDQARVSGSEFSPSRQAQSSEVRQQTQEALQQLSEMERVAFLLKHSEGYSLTEISQVLGVSVNSTKQALFRAVKKLRKALAVLVAA